MRPHLIKCLETKTCSMFPSNPIRKRAKYVEKCESISIHCSCRLPNDGKPMVQCCRGLFINYVTLKGGRGGISQCDGVYIKHGIMCDEGGGGGP